MIGREGIDFGALDTLVTLQTCTISQGSQGQKIFTYTDFRKVFAKVERQVDEMVSNANLEAGQIIQLTIHKVPSLTSRWRVIVDGKPYGITAIDTIDRFAPLCVLSLSAIDG